MPLGRLRNIIQLFYQWAIFDIEFVDASLLRANSGFIYQHVMFTIQFFSNTYAGFPKLSSQT